MHSRDCLRSLIHHRTLLIMSFPSTLQAAAGGGITSANCSFDCSLATCRPRREGEVHGKDYFFVSKAQFEEWLAAGQLLEHAIVYGDYKGIPRQQVGGFHHVHVSSIKDARCVC